MVALNIFLHPVSESPFKHLVSSVQSSVDEGTKIDFLVPSVRHINHLKNELFSIVVKTLPGQLYFGTFFAWANRILDYYHQAFRSIGSGEEWLLLFDYFKNHQIFRNKLKPGSLALIGQILTELQESGLTNPELTELFKKDNSDLLANYIPALQHLMSIAEDKHLASASTLLCLANDALDKKRFDSPANYLIVDGFYEFNPIQRRLLQNLIDCYKQVTLYYPGFDDHPALAFLNPVDTVLKNRDLRIFSIDKTPPNFFNKLSETFFRNLPTDTTPNSTPDPQEWSNDWTGHYLKLLRCPNRRIEVDAAARAIKSWILAEIPADRIAVLYRGSYDYSSLIRLIFPVSGIPVPDSGQSLLSSMPVRIIRKIFEINERNFSRESIIDLTRFAEIRNFYGSETIQKFEYKSGAWGLSFHKDSWMKQLQRRKEYLEMMIQAGLDDAKDLYILKKELAEIDVMLPVIQQFLTDIYLPSSASWLEYFQIVNDLLLKYCNGNSDNPITIEAIHKIHEMFRNFPALLNPGQSVRLCHFIMAFNNLCRSVELSPESRSADTGITISNIMDVRGETFEAVVLLGMVDGEFPVQRRENPILSNRQRYAINRQFGVEIFRDSGTNIGEEKFLFYNVINRVKSRLLITYPQFDSNGRSFAESPFLDEIYGLLNHLEPGKYIRFESISAASVIPDIDHAISAEDVLVNRTHYHWNPEDLNFINDQLDLSSLRFIEKRIDVENRRRKHVLDEWSGFIKSNQPLQSFFKKPLSITRLQNYAWCPFLYLCQYVWKIDTAEEPSAELTALSDGLLIHALFEKMLGAADRDNADQWRDYLNRDLRMDISGTIDTINQRFRTIFGYIDEAVWQKKMVDLKYGLELFIQRERDAAGSGFYPDELEKRITFGYPMEFEGASVNIPFQAKIDRIDRNENGSNVIIEYKRSKFSVQDPLKGVEEGIHFQLPFYMLAYRSLIANAQFSGAYSYVFNDGEVLKGIFDEPPYKGVRKITQSELNELLRKTADKIRELLQRIFTGDFSLTPYDMTKRCQLGKCEFYEMCRIDTRTVEMATDD